MKVVLSPKVHILRNITSKSMLTNQIDQCAFHIDVSMYLWYDPHLKKQSFQSHLFDLICFTPNAKEKKIQNHLKPVKKKVC